jgi:hypothetical protein
MDIDPKTIRRKEYKPEELKRDNWTNDEVLHLLREMEFYYKGEDLDKPEPEKHERDKEYTAAIEDVREIFESFKAPEDSYSGPMAYDTKSGFLIYVGPELPAC